VSLEVFVMPRARLCICCRRKGQLNERRFCPDCAICLHCEKRPSAHALGLCERCHDTPGVRVLYLRRRGWTPEWELHLRAKTAEVQRALKRHRGRGRLPRLPPPPGGAA
jgi:hypothetical protein